MKDNKKIAITMGDPSGIGPEIIVKALSSESLINFIPIVIGSKKVIAKQININKSKLLLKEINNSKSDITVIIGGTGKSKDDINFENFNLIIDGLDLKPGRPFKLFINCLLYTSPSPRD